MSSLAPPAPRVCLVTPAQCATNPRLVKEADALHAAGYDVRVVACHFDPKNERLERSLSERPWALQRIPYGPMVPRWRWIGERIAQEACRSLWERRRGSTRLAFRAWHAIVPRLTRAACAVRAELYIAHNLAALPACAAAASRNGGRYAFDAEDFHAGELAGDDRTGQELVRAVEGALLRGCAYVSAASPDIAEAYAQAYGMPVPTSILNVFPRASAPAPAPSSMPGPSLYWFSQTIGKSRGLETAIRAAGLARAMPHLYFRGHPAAGYLEAIAALARESGCADRVHILDPIVPDELPRDAARFDAGLASEEQPVRNGNIALSNKLFTYLLGGIPVLATDTPAQARLAAEVGEPAMRLYRGGDPRQLAQCVDALFSTPGELARARAEAWRLGQERYNWEVESLRLLDLVARVVGAPARSLARTGELQEARR